MTDKRVRKRKNKGGSEPPKKPAKKVKGYAVVDYEQKQLSPREQAAADFYILNGSKYEACVAAGYAETTAKIKAWEIFDRPHMKYYLDMRARERQARHDVTVDDQIHRIDKIIRAFEEIMMLAQKPKLGKKQERRLSILMAVTKGHTYLEAIKLQSHYMGFQPKLTKEAALGPRFGEEDRGL